MVASDGGTMMLGLHFFFSSSRRHTMSYGDWSSDVCSSDLGASRGEDRLGPIRFLLHPEISKFAVGGRRIVASVQPQEEAGMLPEAQHLVPQRIERDPAVLRSEEHTSELQSPYDLVCRLLLE